MDAAKLAVPQKCQQVPNKGALPCVANGQHAVFLGIGERNNSSLFLKKVCCLPAPHQSLRNFCILSIILRRQ